MSMFRLTALHVSTLAFGAFLAGCQSDSGGGGGRASGSSPRHDAAMAAIAAENLVDEARHLLIASTSHETPTVRANALEALHLLPQDAGEYARRLLMDPNRGVRFVAAMTIGRLQVKDAAHLVAPLQQDSSESVRAAALYALKRCGQPVDLSPLAAMLQSTDPEVRANAGMVLGELGDPSALPMLRQAAAATTEIARPARARIVDLQMAEAMVRLGDHNQRHPIRASLFTTSEHHELAAMAAVICGRLKDYEAVGSLKRLIAADGPERRPAEVRMAAAMGLGMLGEPVPPEVATEYMGSNRPELRMQIALTLGEIGDRRGLNAAVELLSDPNPLVQVAAAKAIMQIPRR